MPDNADRTGASWWGGDSEFGFSSVQLNGPVGPLEVRNSVLKA